MSIDEHGDLVVVLQFLADTGCGLTGVGEVRESVQAVCDGLGLDAAWNDGTLTVAHRDGGRAVSGGRVTNVVSGTANVGSVAQLGDVHGTINL